MLGYYKWNERDRRVKYISRFVVWEPGLISDQAVDHNPLFR